jgi:cytochrome b subunit of formate dehydrogenase
MQINVDGFDRMERILHGTAFILIGIFLVPGVWLYVPGIYGLIWLLTGVFAVCPVYIPFKYLFDAKRKRDVWRTDKERFPKLALLP